MSRLYQINAAILPDERDAAILATREAEFNSVAGPRVGDFVLIGDRVGRFSHNWGDGLQWSEGGSFYLYGESASFSGGLNPAIPLENIAATDESRDGTFWFFHHGYAGASCGVGARIPCRVFRATTRPYTVTADGAPYQVAAVDRSDAWREGVALHREALGKWEGWYPAAVTVAEGAP